MNRAVPPLHVLQVFEAAARRGSFTAAAAELFLTPAAVSRRIRALERELGVPLFRRMHRMLDLTEAGRALAERVTLIFGELRRTLDEALDGPRPAPRPPARGTPRRLQ